MSAKKLVVVLGQKTKPAPAAKKSAAAPAKKKRATTTTTSTSSTTKAVKRVVTNPRARRANPDASPAEKAAAIRDYRLKHWGLGGNARVSEKRVPDPRKGVLTKMGDLVAVIYRTSKAGDPKNTDYQHDFSGRNLPELAYSDEGLFVVGGIYRVSWQGIVD